MQTRKYSPMAKVLVIWLAACPALGLAATARQIGFPPYTGWDNGPYCYPQDNATGVNAKAIGQAFITPEAPVPLQLTSLKLYVNSEPGWRYFTGRFRLYAHEDQTGLVYESTQSGIYNDSGPVTVEMTGLDVNPVFLQPQRDYFMEYELLRPDDPGSPVNWLKAYWGALESGTPASDWTPGQAYVRMSDGTAVDVCYSVGQNWDVYFQATLEANVVVHGTVSLEGYQGSYTSVAVTVTLAPNGGGDPIVQPLFLNADGSFDLADIPADTYQVTISKEGWLRATLTVPAVTNPTNLPAVVLKAGDGNVDNRVDFADFAILQNNYGKTAQTANPLALVAADPQGAAAGCGLPGIVLMAGLGLALAGLNLRTDGSQRGPRGSGLVAILLLTILCGRAAADYTSTDQAPREIYPIPRTVQYQTGTITLPAQVNLYASTDLNLGKISMAATDMADRVLQVCGRSQGFTAIASNNPPSEAFQIIVFSPATVAADPTLASQLYVTPYTFAGLPAGGRGRQGFLIRSFLSGSPRRVYVVAQSEQAAYYALMGLVQLMLDEGGAITFRGVDLVDWPAFDVRMTGDVWQQYLFDGSCTPETRKGLIVRKAGGERLTHGAYGYLPEDAYAKDRWFKLDTLYWSRPSYSDIPGCLSFDWSDPIVLLRWEIQARRAANADAGLAFWHDNTDAGTWARYLDQFWANRDPIDRANYPDDPTPAAADAARFVKMTTAIQTTDPETDIMYTVPCYYDSPQNDAVSRVGLFRTYLQTIGAAVPQNVRFMVEDRSPATAAAYQYYLGRDVVNYIYVHPEIDKRTWANQYLSIPAYANQCTGIFFNCQWPQELPNLLSAQYMWNPSVGTDTNTLVNNLVPRAAALAWGPAWREMANFLMENLDLDAVASETNHAMLTYYLAILSEHEPLLNAARARVPAGMYDAKYQVETVYATVVDLRQKVQAALGLGSSPSSGVAEDAASFDDFSLLQNNDGSGDGAAANPLSAAVTAGGCGPVGIILLTILGLALRYRE